MNSKVINRKSVGGDMLSSAPGGPIAEITSQVSKSQNPRSLVSSSKVRVNTAPVKSPIIVNLGPEQLSNKSSGELPQGVDPEKREVGNEERQCYVE